MSKKCKYNNLLYATIARAEIARINSEVDLHKGLNTRTLCRWKSVCYDVEATKIIRKMLMKLYTVVNKDVKGKKGKQIRGPKNKASSLNYTNVFKTTLKSTSQDNEQKRSFCYLSIIVVSLLQLLLGNDNKGCSTDR